MVALFLFMSEDYIGNIEKARTMVITLSIMFQLIVVFTVRSNKYNIRELKRNKYLIASVVLSIALHLIAIYTPLNAAFKFVPLDIIDWLKIIGL
jgi:magnesium-transporting ATPase (P-type)